MNNNNNITIRPATQNDLTAIHEIEMSASRNPWTFLQLQSALVQDGVIFLVAVDVVVNVDVIDDDNNINNNKIVGFIIANVVLDELQICEIAVKQESQNSGIGTALIKKMFDDAKERGATFATLEVRASNIGAISLYKKLGFEKDAIRKAYYQNGEDAILMSVKIL